MYLDVYHDNLGLNMALSYHNRVNNQIAFAAPSTIVLVIKQKNAGYITHSLDNSQ